MPRISANVTKKESDAIREYANACGETMSNLIRKVMISEVMFLNCFHDVQELQIEISIPDNTVDDDDDKIVKQQSIKLEKFWECLRFKNGNQNF